MAYTNRDRILRGYPTLDFNGSRTNYAYALAGSRSGSKVENWKEKIAKGSNAGSAYSTDFHMEGSFTPGTSVLVWRDTSKVPPVVHTDTWFGHAFQHSSVGHLPTDAAKLEAKALSGIYQRIRASNTQFKGASFLAELKETIHGLRHPASAILEQWNRHYDSLEKRKRFNARLPTKVRRADWSKAVSGSILELNFGLKPLISDVRELSKAIVEMVQPTESPRARVSYQSKQDATTQDVTFPTSGSGGIPGYGVWKQTRVIKTRGSVRYVVGLDLSVGAALSAAERLQGNLGLNLQDVAPALWEITSFSWLADYFSNIGEIIEAGTTDTRTVKWIVRTEQTATTRYVWIDQLSSEQYLPGLSNGYFRQVSFSRGTLGESAIIRRTLARTIPLTLGIPSVTFTHPGESFSRMLNLLSVVDQRRKSMDAYGISLAPKRRDLVIPGTHIHL